MPFIYLLLLALVHLRSDWPAPPFCASEGEGQGDAAFIQIVGSMIFVFLAMGLSHWFCLLLGRDPEQRIPLMHDFHKWKRRHSKAFLAFFLLSSYQLGWGWAVQQMYRPTLAAPAPTLRQEDSDIPVPPAPRTGERISMPGFEAVFLSPFLLGLIGSWLFFYRFEKMAHEIGRSSGDTPFVRRGAYVLHLVRQHFLLLVLPLIMMLGAELFTHFVALPDATVVFSATWIAVSIGSALLFLAAVPWLLRLFLGLTPLPDGPLRQRLTETSRRIGLRFSDILLWRTRNTMANALVTGVLPWLRYIVVTDRLLAELHEEEVQAVFGHEAGHVRHHHMAFYILFLFTSVTLLPFVWHALFAGLARVLPHWGETILALESVVELGLLVGVLYIFVAFGFLSRRCERQADLFGAEVASPTAFIFALEKVALINGIPRENPGWFSSWQHSTIARRIEFIERTMADPDLAPAFQRRFALLKWAITLVLVAGTLLVFALSGQNEDERGRGDAANASSAARLTRESASFTVRAANACAATSGTRLLS
jgi:Zn-dependent protease with chaperone function